jgi:hypothetical protein
MNSLGCLAQNEGWRIAVWGMCAHKVGLLLTGPYTGRNTPYATAAEHRFRCQSCARACAAALVCAPIEITRSAVAHLGWPLDLSLPAR